MSGAKRKSKYRKHIETAVLEEFPEPQPSEEVVVVVGSRGGNILEVQPIPPKNSTSTSAAPTQPALCLLPSKYRKLVWVKRGTYLIVSKAADDYETAAGKCGKVKYTVNHILFPKQVKHLVKKGILVLPSVCAKESQETEVTEERIAEEEEEGEGSDEDADLFVNRNRRGGQVSSSSSSSSEEESEEEEAEEEEVEEGIKSEETRALEDTAGVKS